MQCISCSHPNPESARFCNRCGEALALVCDACSGVNPPGSQFCNRCGERLRPEPRSEPPTEPRTEPRTEPPTESQTEPRPGQPADPRSYTPKHLADRILTQKAAIEGERKHVTVLFADVEDSTALAEGVGDPEAVHALLDRAFQIILGQVHHYEGTVNQFTGDGVMALFGAPLALEDAPGRAVVAALGIQGGLAALDREVQERYGRRFQMRIGIHTGPVVVGKIGDDLRMDYTAVGDTTNLAARLQSIARAGTVVVSDATRRLVEGFFDLVPLPEQKLKGISRPVRAFELLEARRVTGRVEAGVESHDGLTSFVGRENEAETLLSAFRQARSGRGCVVFVVGEAGLGKSRLVHEFRRRIANERHVWVEGRCASYGQTSPFYAVADSMRRLYDIDDRDDESGALAKLAAGEGRLGDHLAWTDPYLRVLLSLPSGSQEIDALDAMSRRAEMCRALHARLFGAADVVPQVIVVEDLHWVDTATEEFLSYVAESIPAAPVLMILTHRPGYQHPFGDRSFHVRIPLQPLSGPDMSNMVDSVLSQAELPAPVRELIARKAEGNPLFVEEVTTSLLEEGVLALEGGRAVLTRDLADIAIPDRIQDVLMARLDRLPQEPKRAIQVASVIGREFALRLLSRVDDAAEDLEGIVGELRSLELIYEKAAHPELAYMFKHALTHEVAYESLLVARRKALHRIVGVAIEELYPDRISEHYEALAYHFAESEDSARALHYHELASEKSAAAYANHAAIDHCRKGLAQAECLGDIDPARIQVLQSRLANCCWLTSDFGSSGQAFEAAAALSADVSEASLLMARAAFSYLWDHGYAMCERALARALELADQAGAGGDAGRAIAIVTRDEYELVHGRRIEDSTDAEHALEVAERSGDAAVEVAAIAQLAQRAEWQGDYRRAVTHAERSVDLARRSGSPGDALFASWFLGIASICLGDYAGGLATLGGGLALCERLGDRAIQARLINTLGWAYTDFGCHERAADFNRSGTALAREAVDLGLVAGAPELFANASVNLASNLIALGRFDDAEAQLAPIQDQYDNDPDPWMRWRWSVHLLHQQARLALARGSVEQALALSQRELQAASQASAQKLVCRAHVLEGRIHLQRDDREPARRALTEALAVADRIEHASLGYRARSLLGELEIREGRTSEAERLRAWVTQRIEGLAPGLPDDAARADLRRLGTRLTEDPVIARD